MDEPRFSSFTYVRGDRITYRYLLQSLAWHGLYRQGGKTLTDNLSKKVDALLAIFSVLDALQAAHDAGVEKAALISGDCDDDDYGLMPEKIRKLKISSDQSSERGEGK